MQKIILIILPLVYLFTLLIIAAKSKKPFKTLLITCGTGLLSLLALHFAEKYIGFQLPLNLYTLGGSIALGVPGVICFLILNIVV